MRPAVRAGDCQRRLKLTGVGNFASVLAARLMRADSDQRERTPRAVYTTHHKLTIYLNAFYSQFNFIRSNLKVKFFSNRCITFENALKKKLKI